MILYRPVGLQELALIYDSGMKAFPARLPQQPIFYPVLDLEYARQIASDWNAKNGEFAGYVTQFKVEDQYIGQFEKHTVGGSQHQELWIPAEEMEEFNRHIIGHIKVLEAHFGDGFQGFLPEKFGLQGKTAVEQFTLLANSYIYKRMDFYLEIKRNHKAVFLNYPFWQKFDFKNPGLKEKILQAIKEAWLTSFPKIPLPLPPPVQEEPPLEKQTDSYALVDPVQEDITPEEQTDALAYVQRLVNPLHEDVRPVEQTNPYSLVDPAHENTAPPQQTDSHFAQGIQLGLSGKYHEAIAELFRAVEEDPDDVVAHTSLGVAFHRVGEEDRALACYETALKIDPIYAEAHYFRANILYGRGSVREAIAGYTMAIGLKPELIRAHEEPAPQDRLTDYSPSPAEMYRIAKPAYRILALNKSLETDPGQAALFKERAAEYYRLRNYAQAIADYTSALEIRPEDAGALHSRGVVFEQMGQNERALEDFQQAIAIDAQRSNDYINRGIAFAQTGNYRQALASLTESIRLAPKNPDGYFNRGMAYFQQGNIQNAIADFSRVIQLSSNDEDAYYWRGLSYEEAGRQPEAIADYRRFLVLSKDARARRAIEHKLRQWDVSRREGASRRNAARDDRQRTDPVPLGKPDQDFDLHALIVALGERVLDSIWLGSGVDCYGEKAEELYAFTDHNRPIEGRDFLSITSGIRQTIQGDFQAFDPGANSPWIFLRAWDGSGFYIETNDPKIRERLKAQFPSAEEVDGASPHYEGLFIRI